MLLGYEEWYTEKQLERYKLKYENACKFLRDNGIKTNPAKDFNLIYRGDNSWILPQTK
jgi:hypothetical protein